jgi:hypothetical protein
VGPSPLTAIISHTSELDLWPRGVSYVGIVRQVLAAKGWARWEMDDGSADPSSSLELSLARIDDADVYIGLHGFRYGTIPDGYDRSYTHLEYDRATERGIPRLCFVLGDLADLPPVHSKDPEHGDRQADLRRTIAGGSTVVVFIESAADLKSKLTDALHELDLKRAAPTPTRPVPFMVEPLDPALIGRDDLLAEACAQVRAAREGDEHVVLTTRLVGAGGFGKTVLAQMLAHELRDEFPDGVLWATLGQEVDEVGTISKLHDALEGTAPRFVDLEHATVRLAQVLEQRTCLLILDDVWDDAHLRPYRRIGGGSVCVVTTRLREVAPQAKRVTVDEMTSEEAVQVLVAGLGPVSELGPFERLAGKLGEWPILLGLAAGALADIAGESGTAAALAGVNDLLASGGATVLDRTDAAAREQAVSLTMEYSLRRLTTPERERYQDLGVFREDEDVPLSLLASVWGVDVAEAFRLGWRLRSLSLADLDAGRRTVRVHDVVGAYLVGQLGDRAAARHDGVVAAIGPPELIDREDLFALRSLAYHCRHATDPRTIHTLVDERWRQAQFEAFGSNHTFIGDLDLAADVARAEDPPNLIELVRCAVARAQLVSNAGRLPRRFFGVLASIGEARRAMEVAALTPFPEDRLAAYAEILAHAPDPPTATLALDGVLDTLTTVPPSALRHRPYGPDAAVWRTEPVGALVTATEALAGRHPEHALRLVAACPPVQYVLRELVGRAGSLVSNRLGVIGGRAPDLVMVDRELLLRIEPDVLGEVGRPVQYLVDALDADGAWALSGVLGGLAGSLVALRALARGAMEAPEGSPALSDRFEEVRRRLATLRDDPFVLDIGAALAEVAPLAPADLATRMADDALAAVAAMDLDIELGLDASTGLQVRRWRKAAHRTVARLYSAERPAFRSGVLAFLQGLPPRAPGDEHLSIVIGSSHWDNEHLSPRMFLILAAASSSPGLVDDLLAILEDPVEQAAAHLEAVCGLFPDRSFITDDLDRTWRDRLPADVIEAKLMAAARTVAAVPDPTTRSSFASKLLHQLRRAPDELLRATFTFLRPSLDEGGVDRIVTDRPDLAEEADLHQIEARLQPVAAAKVLAEASLVATNRDDPATARALVQRATRALPSASEADDHPTDARDQVAVLVTAAWMGTGQSFSRARRRAGAARTPDTKDAAIALLARTRGTTRRTTTTTTTTTTPTPPSPDPYVRRPDEVVLVGSSRPHSSHTTEGLAERLSALGVEAHARAAQRLIRWSQSLEPIPFDRGEGRMLRPDEEEWDLVTVELEEIIRDLATTIEADPHLATDALASISNPSQRTTTGLLAALEASGESAFTTTLERPAASAIPELDAAIACLLFEGRRAAGMDHADALAAALAALDHVPAGDRVNHLVAIASRADDRGLALAAWEALPTSPLWGWPTLRGLTQGGDQELHRLFPSAGRVPSRVIGRLASLVADRPDDLGWLLDTPGELDQTTDLVGTVALDLAEQFPKAAHALWSALAGTWPERPHDDQLPALVDLLVLGTDLGLVPEVQTRCDQVLRENDRVAAGLARSHAAVALLAHLCGRRVSEGIALLPLIPEAPVRCHATGLVALNAFDAGDEGSWRAALDALPAENRRHLRWAVDTDATIRAAGQAIVRDPAGACAGLAGIASDLAAAGHDDAGRHLVGLMRDPVTRAAADLHLTELALFAAIDPDVGEVPLPALVTDGSPWSDHQALLAPALGRLARAVAAVRGPEVASALALRVLGDDCAAACWRAAVRAACPPQGADPATLDLVLAALDQKPSARRRAALMAAELHDRAGHAREARRLVALAIEPGGEEPGEAREGPTWDRARSSLGFGPADGWWVDREVAWLEGRTDLVQGLDLPFSFPKDLSGELPVEHLPPDLTVDAAPSWVAASPDPVTYLARLRAVLLGPADRVRDRRLAGLTSELLRPANDFRTPGPPLLDLLRSLVTRLDSLGEADAAHRAVISFEETLRRHPDLSRISSSIDDLLVLSASTAYAAGDVDRASHIAARVRAPLSRLGAVHRVQGDAPTGVRSAQPRSEMLEAIASSPIAGLAADLVPDVLAGALALLGPAAAWKLAGRITATESPEVTIAALDAMSAFLGPAVTLQELAEKTTMRVLRDAMTSIARHVGSVPDLAAVLEAGRFDEETTLEVVQAVAPFLVQALDADHLATLLRRGLAGLRTTEPSLAG